MIAKAWAMPTVIASVQESSFKSFLRRPTSSATGKHQRHRNQHDRDKVRCAERILTLRRKALDFVFEQRAGNRSGNRSGDDEHDHARVRASAFGLEGSRCPEFTSAIQSARK